MEWLEWSRRLNRNRDVLERIVALLLALAVLAERAAGQTNSRRSLGILGHAEAEARAYVVAMARASGALVEPAAEGCRAPGHAERLAASFRALALMLAAMLALARRFARSLLGEASPLAALPMPPRTSADPKRSIWVAALPAPDTS